MTARGDAVRRLRFGAQRAARRAGVVLPGPLRRSARRAREAIAPERPLEQRLSAPLDEADVIELYERSILQQDFYDETYASDLLAAGPAAHEDLARAIVGHLAPRTALDVGCGLGELVAKLRAHGVEASGCDFSLAFLRLAPRRARPHLRQADVTALPYADRSFDVVTCMELLEHLPVPTIDEAIESLRRVTDGTLIVTTPSFGPDGDRRHGLPINEPSWWDDARENRPFRRLILGADGLPDCGHLTLATFRWWTERFLRHGLARNSDLEMALLDAGDRPLRRHGWSLYALHEVRSPEFAVGGNDSRQGGEGFGPVVEGPDGREGRFTGARATFHVRPEPEWRRAALGLSVWAGPATMAHDRRLDVTVGPALPDAGAAPVRASFLVRPGFWRELTVPDVPLDGGIVRVTLETDSMTMPPTATADGYVDGPAVGICLARAALTPVGALRAVDTDAHRLGPPVLETPELRLVGVERRRGSAEVAVAVTLTPELETLAREAQERGAALRLGGHLAGEDGAPLAYDGPRSAPIDARWLRLGNTVRTLVVEGGAPRLQVELMAEGLWWGGEVGLAPLETPLPAIEPPARPGPAPGPPPPPAPLRAALSRIVGTRPSDIDPALFTPYATGEISRLLMVVALAAERPPARLVQVNAYPFLLSQLLEEAFPQAAVERTQAGFIGLTEIEHTLVDPSGATVRTLRSTLVDPERQPLPFADASFDTALMSGVLTWLSHDPALALTEVHRVLEPGGRLILSTVNVARADASRRLADGRGIDGALANAGRGAPQLRNYAAEELFDLLAGNGFAIERHLTRPLAAPERLDAAWYAAADDDGAGDIHYVVARPAERAEPYRPTWLYG